MLRLSSQTQQSKVRAQLELLLRKANPVSGYHPNPRLRSTLASAEQRFGKS